MESLEKRLAKDFVNEVDALVPFFQLQETYFMYKKHIYQQFYKDKPTDLILEMSMDTIYWNRTKEEYRRND